LISLAVHVSSTRTAFGGPRNGRVWVDARVWASLRARPGRAYAGKHAAARTGTPQAGRPSAAATVPSRAPRLATRLPASPEPRGGPVRVSESVCGDAVVATPCAHRCGGVTRENERCRLFQAEVWCFQNVTCAIWRLARHTVHLRLPAHTQLSMVYTYLLASGTALPGLRTVQVQSDSAKNILYSVRGTHGRMRRLTHHRWLQRAFAGEAVRFSLAVRLLLEAPRRAGARRRSGSLLEARTRGRSILGTSGGRLGFRGRRRRSCW